MTRHTIFPERGVHVTAGFLLLLAAAFVLAPPHLTAAVLLSAVLHECGHLLALRAFRVPAEGVRLCASGAVIFARGARRLSYGRELMVTLAGPAANLLAAPLLAALSARYAWGWGYLLAGANALLGVYNLLPIPPLDGGRALYLLVTWHFGPDAGETASAAVGLTAALLVTALGAYVMIFLHGGALFLFAALGLFFGACRASRFIPRFSRIPSA